MKKVLYASLITSVAVAFDNSTGWKVDADGNLQKDANGNPIYVDGSGKEASVEGNTISRLNGEAKTNRERAERAETALKPFEGVDPVAAKTAIETLGKIDQTKLIDAGKLEEVKSAITSQFTEQLNNLQKNLDDAQGRNSQLTMENAFSKSDFISKNVAIPADIFQQYVQKNFKNEDGKVVAYGPDGNPIYSKTRHGELATVDEALAILVDMHPNKDSILKADNQSGSGNNGGGGERGKGSTIKRGDFEALPAHEKSKIALGGEIKIVD